MLAPFRKDGDFIPISGVKGSLLVLTWPKSTSLSCITAALLCEMPLNRVKIKRCEWQGTNIYCFSNSYTNLYII